MKTQQEVIDSIMQGKPLVILVEIDNVLDQTLTNISKLRLSNLPYTTKTTDTPASTSYLPIITGGINFRESVSIEGSVSINYGEIEIDNTDGSYNNWLKYVFNNRTVSIFVGNPEWGYADFYKVFTGIASGASAKSRTSINIILGDLLQKLNYPISEDTFSGSLSNDSRLQPVLLGECFNITPVSTNTTPNTLEYMIHKTSINGTIEVRDSGAPVSITTTDNGKFTLDNSPVGTITCSAQGHKDGANYYNKAPDIIKTILTSTSFGNTNNRLQLSEIDTSNFTTFASTYTYPTGVYCTNKENMLDICNKLALSIGCALVTTTAGTVRLIRIADPATVKAAGIVPHSTITDTNIILDSVSISDTPEVVGSVKIGYCKNWTVQNSGLAAGLPTSSVEIFNSEWLTSALSNSTTLTNYKTTKEVEQSDTLLITSAAASSEASRKLALMGTKRIVYSFSCHADSIFIELGNTIGITSSVLGLTPEVTGLVISVTRDWFNNTIQLGVLV